MLENIGGGLAGVRLKALLIAVEGGKVAEEVEDPKRRAARMAKILTSPSGSGLGNAGNANLPGKPLDHSTLHH